MTQAGSLPVVGVGASAGGLAPTVELLRDLGEAPGVAIVIVHHLDPTHESGLVEILSRATPMSVEAATNGARLLASHVYVVPPNAGLLVSDGVLKVVPRVEEGGLHLPIDRFFESLAVDRNGLAVGVVLSGTGYDGTEGIKAIKREGGITLAQDASAQYAGMPQSAIATGCVDFVLPPSGLAQELRRLVEHLPALSEAPRHAADERDYLAILSAVRRASGVDFTSYKQTTIRRRIQRRLAIHGLVQLSAYRDLLGREPAEVHALGEEMLIHVTGFFREPEAFEALRHKVFPKLCENRPPDTPMRVWVPGCSTGEEVYSIAICLLEFLKDTNDDLPIKIFGTDLSLSIIDKARSGRYPESIARDVSPGRLQRFFTKSDDGDGGYQIRRDVRELCVFAKHDVMRDPPFSAMDLISCRNLMIYFGPEPQDRVTALLHYALKEPGFLVLGSSETVRTFSGFAPLDAKNKIYARTSAVPRLTFDFTAPLAPFDRGADEAGRTGGASSVPGYARSPSPTDVHREADRLVLAEYAPPGVVVTNDLAIVQFRGQTGPFLEPAQGVASLDLFRMAREELRLPLRRAIDRARASQSATREPGVPLPGAGGPGGPRRSIGLEVIPFTAHSAQQRFFLVLFHDLTESGPGAELPPPAAPAADGGSEASLRQELGSTRQYLESVIEQMEAANEELQAANEEVVSSNEELRSTNEELQSAKEELQATNEELRTVNEEMIARNAEATRLSDDLTNVLTSVDIPILIAGRDLRLTRFTPAAGKVFGLAASDVGRPMSDVHGVVAAAPALTSLMTDVLERYQPVESVIKVADGRWHHLSVRPYVTLDGRIDGTVISARDIDAETRSGERLAAARKLAEEIVDRVREPLVVADRERRIHSANKAFLRTFRFEGKDVQGRRIEDLGRPELSTAELQAALEDLGPSKPVEGLRIEQGDALGGPRVFVLTARHIDGTELSLVAFEDITDAARARIAVERAELSFRDALTGAAEGVLMVDASDRILFANRAAEALFGLGSDELVGLSVTSFLPGAVHDLGEGHERRGQGHELTGRRKNGTEFPVEVALSSIVRDGEQVLVAFVTDITRRRDAEKKISAYQDRLQQMAFDAALTEERERRRIAIELHDRIGQALALAQIKLTAVRADVTGPPRAAVQGAVELLQQAITDQRELVFDLSPPVLYDLGLKAALAWLAEDVEKRHGVRIEIEDDGAEKPLDDAAKGIVFRAVRELVMNVLKHAKSPMAAKVSLFRTDDHVDIRVEDQGVGFDPDAPMAGPSGEGFGLLSVREQITRLGGTLEVESAPSKGTRVRVRVPVHASAAAAPSDAGASP